MKELVIISGKGGTGKTSVSGTFAALVSNAVLADCDVDASDLHLILKSEIVLTNEFVCGHEAKIDPDKCTGCGMCFEYCRFDAVQNAGNGLFKIDPVACEGCGVCVHFCPVSAIEFPHSRCGHWYLSETKFGFMVHAKLDIGAENSGKLVSIVRSEAKKAAETGGNELILIDGPPGVGCPVIASIANVDAALIVTEPTLSGEHDLRRVLELCRHFGVKALVCVNKWDINPEMSNAIKILADESENTLFAGKISYDRSVTAAQIAGVPVVEYDADSPAARDMKALWEKTLENLSTSA